TTSYATIILKRAAEAFANLTIRQVIRVPAYATLASTSAAAVSTITALLDRGPTAPLKQ
ncbi:hypothetical protein TSMEX_011213, partial [Taenia solium]